jgi:hypothetical protein
MTYSELLALNGGNGYPSCHNYFESLFCFQEKEHVINNKCKKGENNEENHTALYHVGGSTIVFG